MSPAKALTLLIINAGLGMSPTNKNDVWPVFFSGLPDSPNVPDNAICVYDRPGKTQGRNQRTGQVVRFPGFQVKVRSNQYDDAQTKMDTIVTLFDTTLRQTVTNNTESVTIQAITAGQPIAIGKSPGNRPRDAITLNGILSFV